MIVRYSESLEIDPRRRYDVFAFAGFLSVYQTGMTLRDALKAIMSVRGTGWVKEMEDKYPLNTDYGQRKIRKRKPKIAAAVPATK